MMQGELDFCFEYIAMDDDSLVRPKWRPQVFPVFNYVSGDFMDDLADLRPGLAPPAVMLRDEIVDSRDSFLAIQKLRFTHRHSPFLPIRDRVNLARYGPLALASRSPNPRTQGRRRWASRAPASSP